MDTLHTLQTIEPLGGSDLTSRVKEEIPSHTILFTSNVWCVQVR
jgi:hypothetical protein